MRTISQVSVSSRPAATHQNDQRGMSYLDMQAYVGITKHNGGLVATDELLSLCHMDQAHEVLEVGCGTGAGATHIAKKYGCHVIGIDLAEKMIAWSRRRTKEERIEDKVAFQVGDVLDLSFDDNHFDVVIVESVLAFVENKRRAIQECIRVTKPGGYVGLNEAYLTEEASPQLVERVQASLGSNVPTAAVWESIWNETALQDRVVRFYRIDPGKEIRDRIQWIGWGWMLRAWGRLIRLYVTNPPVRKSLREMFDAPREVMEHMGYGLLVGRKEA
jgi:ubiquinone/menaquinone biosynthesis C-methylase UbiE